MNLAAAPTIAELARQAKPPVPYRTMRDRLLRRHEKDRLEWEAAERKRNSERPFVPWLYKFPTSRWRVNLSRLRRLHPEMDNVRPLGDVDTDIRRMKRQLEVLDAGHRAVVKRVASGGAR